MRKTDAIISLFLPRKGLILAEMEAVYGTDPVPQPELNTRQLLLGVSKKWPSARIKLVENKANGPAIIDSLKTTIGGFKEIEPRGSKAARAEAVAPQIFAGEVFLPTPEKAPWVSA